MFEIIEAQKKVSREEHLNKNEVHPYTGLRQHNDDVVLHRITDIICSICYLHTHHIGAGFCVILFFELSGPG